MKVRDAPETDFANVQSCGGTDCPTPWIEANGAVYTFALYTCDAADCIRVSWHAVNSPQMP